MKKQKMLKISRTVLLGTIMIALAGFATAGTADPMMPDVAAKVERTKRQQAERITPAKRKAAAEALKAQRKKLHGLRQNSPQHIQEPVGYNPNQNSQGN